MKRLHIARCAPCSGNKPSLDIEEEYSRPAHSTVRRYGPTLGHLWWGPGHCEGARPPQPCPQRAGAHRRGWPCTSAAGPLDRVS